MKKIYLSLTLVILILLSSCSQNQDEVTSQTKTKLTFSLSSSDVANGRKQSNGISNVTSVSISLTTSTGEEVFTHQTINISSFGDGFITNPVELEAGHYILTDFFLLGDSSKVLYATPHRGSFLGVLPKQPLDREFSVARNKVNTMALEVVEVEGYTPEDFGYKSFSVEALKFFSVSVKIEKQGKSVFTTADGILLQGTDTVGVYKLGTEPKLVKFSGDENADYEFVVIKDGFARYNKHFNFKDLLIELNHKPLLVNLEPAFTFRLNYLRNNSFPYDSDDHSVLFEVTTYGVGTYTLTWGDGTVEELTSQPAWGDPSYYSFFAEHSFPSDSVDYFLSITGDLNKIKIYGPSHSAYDLGTINFDALSNLQYVSFYVYTYNGILDVRQNTKLERLDLSCQGVLLPKQSRLNYIKLFPGMENSLDYAIDNIYSNAVSNNIMNGLINFSMSYYDYSSTETLSQVPIKIPTSSSRIKLKKLRDIYKWEVYPPLEAY